MHSADSPRAACDYRPTLTLVRVDGRTKIGRFRRKKRADWVRHVGGSPNAVEAERIELAVEAAVELEALKELRAKQLGGLTEDQRRTLFAAQNTLRRIIDEFDAKPAAARIRTPLELLAEAEAA